MNKHTRKLRLDLTGKKIGKLIPIKWTKFNGRHRYWLCKCDCGNEKEIAATHLIRGLVNSCGCDQFRIGERNNAWKGCGGISGAYFSSIKRHANKRKIQFNVNIEYLWNLFQEQKGKCALSGLDLTFPSKYKERYTASLDRIDSLKGYNEGNVQWILGDINWMKNNFNQEYFIDICKKIANNR